MPRNWQELQDSPLGPHRTPLETPEGERTRAVDPRAHRGVDDPRRLVHGTEYAGLACIVATSGLVTEQPFWVKEG